MIHNAARDGEHRFNSESELTLDLTDGSGALVEDFADSNPEGVRLLLAALDLTSGDRVLPADSAPVFDLAMYRATGSVHLAELFCREFRIQG